MSTLARIRQVPARGAEPLVDLARLADLYRRARCHDQEAYNLRREGEELIREAQAQGVPVIRIAEAAQIKKQRVYQVLQGPTVKPREETE